MSLTRSELTLILTLALIQFTHIMDFMIVMPLGPMLIELFNITPAQFSLVVSGYAFSAGASGLLSAFLLDRFDRKKALLFLYTGFLIGTLACAFAPTYVFLLAARVLTGAFGGVLGALIYAIIGDVIPRERRGRAMGIAMTSFSVASIAGVPFGLFLANLYGWHAPFIFLVAVGLPILVIVGFRVPELRAHLEGRVKESPFALFKEIGRNSNQIKALSLIPALMLGHFTMVPFFSPYMVMNVGFNQDQLAYIYLLGGLATLFTSPWVGRTADRVGSSKVFTIAAALSLFPVAWVTHMGHTALPLALVVTTLFFVVTNARFVPAQAIVTSAVSPRRRGGFMSINSSFQQIAGGLASIVAGLIVTRNEQGMLVHYNYLFYATIVANLVCIWLSRQIRPATDG